MTLDISKFIANSIRTQSKIHHLDINVKATKTADVPQSVTSLITKDYGDKYLDDADYVAFFWGGIDKERIEKLFNVVDKALGKSANKLTDKDFKKLAFKDSSNKENEEKEEIEVDDDNDEEESSDDIELEIDDDSDDEADDNKNTEDVELNEDDDSEDVKIEVKEENIPTAYFFLKITTK